MSAGVPGYGLAHMGKANTWVIGGSAFAAHAGLYFAFTANVGVREIVAAAATAAVATAAVLVFARAGQASFRFRAGDVAAAWRMPWYALTGTAQVLQGLWKQLAHPNRASTVLAAVPFDMGEADDRRAAGRRALAVTLTTATPNFVVLGLVEEQGVMLYHQIVPADVTRLTRRLGARP